MADEQTPPPDAPSPDPGPDADLELLETVAAELDAVERELREL